MNNYENLDYEYVSNNSLFSYNVINYCKENRILTLKEFILFFETNGVLSDDVNFKLEIEGLVDLIKYKYLGIISEEIINIVNNSLCIDNSFYYNNFKNSMKVFSRLGFNKQEAYTLTYFGFENTNCKISDIFIDYIKTRSYVMNVDQLSKEKFKNKSRVLYSLIKSIKRINKKSLALNSR